MGVPLGSSGTSVVAGSTPLVAAGSPGVSTTSTSPGFHTNLLDGLPFSAMAYSFLLNLTPPSPSYGSRRSASFSMISYGTPAGNAAPS